MSWRADELVLNGNTVTVRQIGNNGPPILLIHGYTDSSLSWTRLGEDLSDRFRVIAPDMVGHGQSMPLPGPWSVASYIEDVLALVDRLRLEQVVLCGHSMGGVIGAGVAAGLAERAVALIAEDPAWLLLEVPEPEYLGNYERVKEWKSWVTKLRGMSWAEAINSISDETEGWHPVDREVYLKDRLAFDISIFEQLDFSVRNRWREHLQQSQASLLLVTGNVDKGGIIGDEFAKVVFAENGGGERLHVPEAGHGIHRETYDTFYAGVNTFLEKRLL